MSRFEAERRAHASSSEDISGTKAECREAIRNATSTRAISKNRDVFACIRLRLTIPRTAMLIVITFGLAVASIVAGVIGIIRSAKFNTEFSLLGVKLSTAVCLGIVGIGLLLAYFTILWSEF